MPHINSTSYPTAERRVCRCRPLTGTVHNLKRLAHVRSSRRPAGVQAVQRGVCMSDGAQFQLRTALHTAAGGTRI